PGDRAAQRLVVGLAAAERAHDDDRLPFHRVWNADRGRFDHARMGGRGSLDLGRADALAADLQRVVRPSADVPVAVVVDDRPVAVDPDRGHPAPVRLDVAIRVEPEATRHPRLGRPDDELADLAAERLAGRIDDVGGRPDAWAVERRWLDRGQEVAADDAAADLRAARVVHDRRPPTAHPAQRPPPAGGTP